MLASDILDRVAALLAGERSSGTVVGAGASLALVGALMRDPAVRSWLPRGSGCEPTLLVGRLSEASPTSGIPPLVRTVLRLLSSEEAAAVFRFASARSRSSIVSWGALLATSFVLVSFRQPAPNISTER